MRLAIKLVTSIILGIIIILAIDGYITIRHDLEIIQTDMTHDAFLVGRVMKNLITNVWRLRGQQRAIQLIEEANKGANALNMNIRWVCLSASPDDSNCPSVPLQKLTGAVRGEEISVVERDKSGARFLYTYIPIPVDKQRAGALEIAESFTQLDKYLYTAVMRKLILIGVLILVSGFFAILLGFGMIGRPLNFLIEKVRRVGEGDLSVPLYLKGGGEFPELAEALNKMCEHLADARENVRKETAARITAIEQLRHADRLRTVGGLASGIAHELGTPLNVVFGRAGLIAKGNLSNAEIIESANIIRLQTEGMTAIIRQLLDFARHRSPQRTNADIRQIVVHTLDFMAPLGQKQKTTLHFTGTEAPVIAMIDTGQIQQVLTNLISNAIQAMPTGGKVEVGIRRDIVKSPENHGGAEAEYVCVYVHDGGEGIPVENLEKVFEPFFTTKDIGKGTGLGLSIAYGIIKEHGGWIDVKSKLGEGSCFSIYLPQEVSL